MAFKALLSKPISNVGPNQHIIFDIVKLNFGNAYSNIHGSFTTPVAGTYMLTVHVCSGGAHYVHLEMVQNGDVISEVLAGDAAYTDCADSTTVAVLQAGDVIFVRHHSSVGDFVYSSATGYTTGFNGVLLGH